MLNIPEYKEYGGETKIALMAQHRKRLNEDSFMIEKGEEPRSSSVKMKIGAKK